VYGDYCDVMKANVTVSTVVLDHCKGDKLSQWEIPNFQPL